MFEIIIKRLYELGILEKVVLIGSWAAFLYKSYFGKGYRFIPKTTDVDILVPIPCHFRKPIDLPEKLKDLNYIVQFSGQKGYIRLGHPELTLEFLVPEFGKGSDEPYQLKDLHINAQPLRYVNLLLRDSLNINYQGIDVKVPHPTVFVLQKLLILDKRQKEEKRLKDIEIIKSVLKWINQSSNDKNHMKNIFSRIPSSWQKKIIKQLRILTLDDTLYYLSKN